MKVNWTNWRQSIVFFFLNQAYPGPYGDKFAIHTGLETLDLKQSDSKRKVVNMRKQQRVNLEVILQVWNLKFIKEYLQYVYKDDIL